MRRLPGQPVAELGIVRRHRTGGGVIEPVNKKQMKEWHLDAAALEDAKDGELVRFSIERHGRVGGARIIERLGNPEAERAVSLIAIHHHDIPDVFPPDIEKELAALTPPTLKGRDDLRQIPLITIDPADARDHDDAVWAAPDTDPANAGGFIVIVAIADVAYYVRTGTALDREAKKRGNSVYFPDRVVPMLPEALSNDLCSLKEGEDRPCLAVRMVFSTATAASSATASCAA